MNIKPESEIIPEEEINLYDYWKTLVKRKKIFMGVFLAPLAIVTIVSFSIPRYYRGEGEITKLIIPAANVVNLIGNVDDTQKTKIFTNNSNAINKVLMSVPKKTNDTLNIVVEAKTADIIPQAFLDILNYINNLKEVKEKHEKNNLALGTLIEEIDLKLPKLIEAKDANLIFLNQIMDMMKKRQLSFVFITPADLIKKDLDLSLEITNLQTAKADLMRKKELKVAAGILSPPAITKQLSHAQIKRTLSITSLLSLFAGIFVVFFLEYIDRMKARENH